MLIQKGYDAGSIVCFKLVTGDEIIARVESDNADAYVISRPCTVVPSPQGLGLMQSLFSADINTSISLNKDHVIMHSPVVDKIENHYIQTTTGIQPVTKGGIIT